MNGDSSRRRKTGVGLGQALNCWYRNYQARLGDLLWCVGLHDGEDRVWADAWIVTRGRGGGG